MGAWDARRTNNSLRDTLLKEIVKSKGYKIMLVGDFNAHVKLVGENIRGVDDNGENLCQLCTEGGLKIKNMDQQTQGVWTWERGEKKVSNKLYFG